VISKSQLEKVLGYIALGQREGASLAAGGVRPTDARLEGGYYVEPTVLDGVTSAMRVHQEEIFGPVLTVTTFSDVDEAVRLANATEFGLLAGVWTTDINTALSVAGRVRVGQVYVNTYGAGGGVELPFGGFKKSGFGREKGLEALGSYLQTKNVCIKFGVAVA
jgi:acyl-CoA reductase-like NAD-dependent aldehyde dehydrogenase